MRTVSLGTMIKQLDGLVDTIALGESDNAFVSEVVEQTKGGLVTSTLTERQIEYIEGLYRRHFA